MKQALKYLVAFLAIQFVVEFVVMLVWQMVCGAGFREAMTSVFTGSESITAPMMIVVQAAFSIVALVVFLWRRWCVVSDHYLKTWPWAVFLWSAIAALGTLVPAELFQELVPIKDFNSELLGEMMSSRWGYLAVCIFAPLVEELVFRGAILRSLLGSLQNHWTAILVSALIFAIAHINPAQMPHAFCLGVLLGWMYYRTHSVLPGIIVHWVNNTVAYAMFNILPNAEDFRLIDLWGGSKLHIGMALLFSLLIFIPAIVQLHLNMRRTIDNSQFTIDN